MSQLKHRYPIFLGLLSVCVLFLGLRSGQAYASTSNKYTSSRPQNVAWPDISLHPFQAGFQSPTHIANAGDGSQRLFIVEQNGVIRVLQNGVTLSTPFLDIRDRVLFSGGEQGLLSVAFPPNFANKGYFYVYYTQKNGDNRTARFSLKPGDPDQADPASEKLIITFNHQSYSNHDGGQLAFGPDGYLYIGTGDGGGGGDPLHNGQNTNSLLGKLLRIDVEGDANPYAIPSTNPYTQTAGYKGEIWALGLRNPWRFSFDRLTGDVFIADVGQDTEEEVDYQPASSRGGENYGWNILEGSLCYSPSSGCTPPNRYAAPVTTYPHGVNDAIGCAITGGAVYRGSVYPRMQGMYFYGDFCSGKIWGLIDNAGWQVTQLLDKTANISSFGEDEAGNLYLADWYKGMIFLVTDSVTNYTQHMYLPALAKP